MVLTPPSHHMDRITVIKRDFTGRETYCYQGKLISRDPERIVLEATFDREEVTVDKLILTRGDRFVETYYFDRWYNIFEVHNHLDDRLKGWYCNIGHPAEFRDKTLSYRDLGLDLLVYPDGGQVVLDEDEFSALPLSPQVRARARAALVELQDLFKTKA